MRPDSAPSKLRVAVALPSHWAKFSGGAEQQVRYLLESLAEDGSFHVRYLAGNVCPEFSSADYELVDIGRGQPPGRISRLAQAFRLYRALKCFAPDVIYQRVGCAYTGAAAAYARINGARLVWHVASQADVVTGSGTRFSPLATLEKHLLEFGIRSAHRIIVQTREQGDAIARNYGRDDVALIRNFHPIPEPPKQKPGPFKVVWIANHKPLKRPELFIELAGRLKHLPCTFTMVGRLPSGDRDAALKRRIATLSNLDHLGPVSNDRVNQLLSESHLLLNTSVYEGFSNTFIQAWLHSVPVVTLGVDPDRMISGRSLGRVAHSFEELVRLVEQLVLDPEGTSLIGAHARRVAVEEFSLTNASRLVDLIRLQAIESRNLRSDGSPTSPERSR